MPRPASNHSDAKPVRVRAALPRPARPTAAPVADHVAAASTVDRPTTPPARRSVPFGPGSQ